MMLPIRLSQQISSKNNNHSSQSNEAMDSNNCYVIDKLVFP